MNVFVTIGLPGVGKSTWLKENAKGLIVSRDAIRFAMLQEGEDYFAHEDEVLKEFKEKIAGAIAEDSQDLYIDATHLTPKARKYIFDLVKGKCAVNALWFRRSLRVALAQNDKREGLAFVPKSVIRRMSTQMQAPTTAEGFEKIIEIF